MILMTSITHTTDVYPYQLTYREFICTHLFLFVWIFDYLWSSVRISSFFENLSLFMIIHENLFFFYENLFQSFLSVRVFLDFLFVRIYFFTSLWKKASFWMPSFKINLLSSKHDKDILLISYLPSLWFLVWFLLILCLIIFLLNKMFLNFLNSVSTLTPDAWNASLNLIQQTHQLFFL